MITRPVSENRPPANPCIQTHSDVTLFLECVSSDGRVYGFAYSHLSSYRLEPNPAFEHAPDAPPERLALWFSTHQVLILGSQLDRLRDLIRKGAGFTVKPLETRYANLHQAECFVAEVTVLPQDEPNR